MSFQLCGPSPPLSHYVKHYWEIENHLPVGRTHSQRIVPTGLMELSFYLGDRPKMISNRSDLTHKVLISGQQKAPFDIVVGGHLCLFSVAFRPLGAMMLLNLPLGELRGMTIPLNLITNNATEQIETALLLSESFEQKVAAVEKFLARTFLQNQDVRENAAISDSIGTINRSRGSVPISMLASRACLGRKQYERVFTDKIGVTPKNFLRIVRFQNAIHSAQVSPAKLHLTGLAYDCGYYDQSHMINDFKSLSGMTPKQYFTQCSPFSDYFS